MVATAQKAVLKAAWRLADAVGRGHRWVPVYVGRVFPGDATTDIPVFDDSVLRVRLADGYWVRLLNDNTYEPEVQHALEAVLPQAGSFIDCGANIGYWSLFASEHVPTVAVEAAAGILPQLHGNNSLNGERFKVVEAAVWSHGGETLSFAYDSERHGASAISDDGTATVMTTTIDHLTRDLPGPVVIKLDVEGAEIPAIEGGRRTLDDGAVLIYEDHGQDTSCEVSRFLMESVGLTVVDLTDGAVLSNVAEVAARKPSRTVGYNFGAYGRASELGPLLTRG